MRRLTHIGTGLDDSTRWGTQTPGSWLTNRDHEHGGWHMACFTKGMDHDDRRRCPRARYRGIAFVQLGDVEIPCVANDLSENGISVDPQNINIKPEADLRVTFVLPTIGRWLRLRARLTRRGRVRRRMVWGLRFERVPYEVRHLLREYVADHAPTVMSAPPPLPEQSTRPPIPRPVPAASHPPEPLSEEGGTEGATEDRPRETIRGYRSMTGKPF